MSRRQKLAKMKEAIERRGILLVYPLQNRDDIPSLWSELYPKSQMHWSWDQDADDRVGELWILREELSRSGDVVYSKWFRNRATFFSKEVFTLLLAYFGSSTDRVSLPRDSKDALESFLMDSPQSTKVIKENLGWQGKMMESHYNRALKKLWSHLFLVGFGEVNDSSFPSLNMGAAQNLFEDLWLKSQEISSDQAEEKLRDLLSEDSLFFKQAVKLKKMN